MAVQNVAILGASDKPERYANRALKLLLEKGHRVFPVHPRLQSIEGVPVYHSLKEIPEKIHTVTIYLNPVRTKSVLPEIIKLKPDRVIFNPGTEAPQLYEPLRKAGIDVEAACNLVLLKTNQF